MQVGINYPWRDYGWDFGVAPPGWRPRGARPHWVEEIDGDLRRFQQLGISVVRWFILGDGLTYGIGGDAPRLGPDDSWQFDPPAIDPEVLEDFEELLQRFERAGVGAAGPVQLLPVLIDFHFGLRGRSPGMHGWVKSGRADAIIDPVKRERFFDGALEPLLRIAQAHPDAIYAWDVINEPEWITFGWHPHWWRTPPVDERDMRAFLEEGCARVQRAGFRPTVGFALSHTLLCSRLPADVHQCHHYPGGRHGLAPPLPDAVPAILGEFATASSDRWPELPDWDQGVLSRLRVAAERGYSLALPWSFRATDRHTSWSAEVERDIADFTRGGREMGTVPIEMGTVPISLSPFGRGVASTHVCRTEGGARMASPATIDRLADQQWLDKTADSLAPAVHQALQAPQVSKLKNLLHGVGFGHPLHPVLTDVPIGAWTAALAMDWAEGAGHDEYGPGADAALAVGLAGALGAAVTGLADWSETGGRARREGLLHGLLNIAATTLVAGSLVARRRDRAAGRTLARLGYGISVASAYLGGSLVFSRQIGVDHTADQELSTEFVPVMRADDLPEQQMRRVEVGDVKVLLVKQHGRIHALNETCAHLGGPLSEGTLEEGAVVCPWHGSRYALEDGAVLDGPSAHPQTCFEVRVSETGVIEVRTPPR